VGEDKQPREKEFLNSHHQLLCAHSDKTHAACGDSQQVFNVTLLHIKGISTVNLRLRFCATTSYTHRPGSALGVILSPLRQTREVHNCEITEPRVCTESVRGFYTLDSSIYTHVRGVTPSLESRVRVIVLLCVTIFSFSDCRPLAWRRLAVRSE